MRAVRIASHNGIKRSPIRMPTSTDGQCNPCARAESAPEISAGHSCSKGFSKKEVGAESGGTTGLDDDKKRRAWKKRERPEVAPVATRALVIEPQNLPVVGVKHE